MKVNVLMVRLLKLLTSTHQSHNASVKEIMLHQMVARDLESLTLVSHAYWILSLAQIVYLNSTVRLTTKLV